MNRKKLTIQKDEELQTRYAELLSQVSGRFRADVWIEYGNKRVNAKSVMGVLSLRLRPGSSFTVEASGPDEDNAAAAVAKLVEKGEA